MSRYRVINLSRNNILAERVDAAESFFARCRGLLGTRALKPSNGLWISPCRSIHTWGMRYPIDALFIDGDNRLRHAATYRPWRVSRVVPSARGVLELAAGTLERTGTRIGDRIRLDPVN